MKIKSGEESEVEYYETDDEDYYDERKERKDEKGEKDKKQAEQVEIVPLLPPTASESFDYYTYYRQYVGDKNFDINKKDFGYGHRYTLFEYCWKENIIDVALDILMEREDFDPKKNNINIKNENGDTLLIYAVRSRYKYIVLKLLSFPEINECEILFYATKSGNIDIVKLLLDKYGNKFDNKIMGQVLISAIISKNQDLIKLFLSQPNININFTNKDGYSPLMYSLLDKKLNEISKILISRSGINLHAVTNKGLTILKFAAYNGDSEIFTYLLKKGLSINAKDKEGDSILSTAIDFGNVEIVEILLSQENIVIHQTNAGKKEEEQEEIPLERISLLYQRNQEKSLEIMELFIKYAKKLKIDFDITMDDEGHTPLLCFVSRESVKIVDLLLKNTKIDVNKCGPGAPLMMAVICKNIEIVNMLINHKDIRVNFMDKAGNTALMVAIYIENKEIIKILLTRSDPNINNGNNTILTIAAGCSDKSIMARLFLLSGIIIDEALVNHQDKDGDTALIIAAKTNKVANIDSLLSFAGIDIDKVNNDGDTALSIAQKNNYTDIVEAIEKYINKQQSANIIVQEFSTIENNSTLNKNESYQDRK